MDEISGTRADATPTGNTLSENNTVASTTGIISNAAVMDRTNHEWLYIPDASQTGLGVTGDFSVSMWINFTAALPSYALIFSKMEVTNYSYETRLGVSGYDMIMIFFADNTGTNYAQWKTDGDIIDIGDVGNWVHYVFTFDVSSATGGIIYKNGVAHAMQAKTGTATSINNSTAAFRIGSTGEVTVSDMDGSVDEVGFWNRVLTPAEVVELYNGGAPGYAQQYPFVPLSPFPSHYNT